MVYAASGAGCPGRIRLSHRDTVGRSTKAAGGFLFVLLAFSVSGLGLPLVIGYHSYLDDMDISIDCLTADVIAAVDVDATCHDERTCGEVSQSSLSGRAGHEHAGRELLALPCDCSGHGQCVTDTITLATVCSCSLGWSGPSCSVVVDCAAHQWCGGRGICVKGGICACDPGWGGPDCTVGLCPQNCSSHGICNPTTRQCACDPGWEGRACSIRGCAGNCSSHGACVDGQCECDPGYRGINCEIFECINECSGNGVCSQSLQRCECSPWFTGEDCSTQLCPHNCSGHGTCMNGKCVCDAEWFGSDCSNHLCPKACSKRGNCQADGICACQTGYTGPACDLLSSCPVWDCSGHGTCRVSLGQNATCDCDPGWEGMGCEFYSQVQSSSCLNNCSSHGSCINGTICLCDGGWSGPDCSIGGGQGSGCLHDCSGHGACTNGTCTCDPGWGDKDCSLADSSILCAKNCSSGSGIWRNGTCACDMGEPVAVPCPGNCSGWGACVNGTCVCDVGHYGPACDLLKPSGDVSTCKNNCSAHGTCSNGTCLCDMGWILEDCSLAGAQGPGGGCPGNCSSHGSCSVNNTCLCDLGFFGDDCSLDAESAPPCASNCSSRGLCINATCMCQPGFIGKWCEQDVRVGSTPMPDMENVTSAGLNPICPGDGCSGHGACLDGMCVCDPFYFGEACDLASGRVITGCPSDCSQHGTCLNGTCMCDPMWDGADCSYPSMCPGFSEAFAANCSGHGVCSNGTCHCNTNWNGIDCSIAACPGKCSGHGICANGTCSCDLGWAGTECSRPGCPGSCSGHGICTVDIFTGQPSCTCDKGWSGAGCSTIKCPSANNIPCSGHGACFQGGECLCFDKYAGDDCSILVDCSGRGTRKCGFCSCAEGFTGSECEIDVCADSRVYDPAFPTDWRKSTVCGGRGTCTTARGCVCSSPWAGRNCSTPAFCTTASGVCNGHGACSGSRDDAGSCTCSLIDIANTIFDTPQFTGRYCDIPQCPGYRGIDSTGVPIECSGKGTCNPATRLCSCFSVQGEGSYTGPDCGVPPIFFLQDIKPKVGPLEGGTMISLFGPGIERFFARVLPREVYCDFGAPTRTKARIGNAADSLVCESPPVSQAMISRLALTDINGLAYSEIKNTAQFEFFAQTRIVRITPSYGPLRPTGLLRGPADTNLNNTITVSGTYFPPDGDYACKFGDCDAFPRTSRRIDASTLVCEMPTIAAAGDVEISVSSNNQQFSNTRDGSNIYSIFAITSISPKCAASAGSSVLTIYGENLVDTTDTTRNANNQYCRFGRVTLSGQTRSAGELYAPGFKLFAFHSQAKISTRAVGALECMVPNWPIEVSDFAITLDGRYKETNAALKDGYYVGQWDASPTVKFNSYYPPAILLLPGPGNQVLPHSYIVEPTIGPSVGGTRVTIAGMGFDYARYGPESGNDVYAAWTPSLPNCNPPPIPSCRFGTSITKKVEILNNETIVCITTLLPDEIFSTQTVSVQVSLDGQTFSSEAIQFQFHPPHAVTNVFPKAGRRTGGTTLTVEGQGFVSSFTDGNGGSPRVLTCVFVSLTNPAIRVKALSTRFLTPQKLTCVAPEVAAPGTFYVDVSMSGQVDDTQLSGSPITYDYYQDPVITSIQDDIGTIFGGETVRLSGNFFLGLPDLKCSFGDTSNPIPGSLVNGQVQCVAPAVTSPRTVRLEITLNGIDWSTSNPPMFYTFYNLTSISPSSGPAHGGTFIFATIDGGPNFAYNKTNGLSRFVYRAKIGDNPLILQGSLNSNNTIVFEPRRDDFGGLQRMSLTRTNGSVDFQIALTTSDQFKSFPGFKFILYTASISTVIPCMSSACKDLVLPKNGLSYPVTFKGVRLENVNSIRCGYIPMNRSMTNPAAAFRTFTAGSMPPLWYPGTYYPNEDAIGCYSPPLSASSTDVDGYYTTVALNGQNFDGLDFSDEVFNLIYLPQPDVRSISISGGLAIGGLPLTVTASNWNYPSWFRANQAPPTLSCLFFLPGAATFKFVEAKNPQCTGTTCTAVCTTPNFQGEASTQGVLTKSQVFISLNRRDPCMRCGCNQANVGNVLGTTGFGKASCSNVAANLDDKVTLLSRSDSSSGGFCSPNFMVLADAFFCGPEGTTCPRVNDLVPTDTAFTCLGNSAFRFFTFYQPPGIVRVSPSSIAGFAVHNNSGIQIILSGSNFTGSQWADWPWPLDTATRNRPVRIRATYQDRRRVTLVLDGRFNALNMGEFTVSLPIPCVDSYRFSASTFRSLTEVERARCFNFTRVALNQTLDLMKVSFEISFNNGTEYTPSPHTLNVYKEDVCPDEANGGCGHGSCIDAGSLLPDRLTARGAPSTCFCGFWVGDDVETCPVPTDNIAFSSDFQNVKRTCKRHVLWYNAGADDPSTSSQLDSTVPQSLPWLFDNFGKSTLWPAQDVAKQSIYEISCTNGPQVVGVEPSVGSLAGNTTVLVSMQLLVNANQAWSDYTEIRRPDLQNNKRLDSYFTCFFGNSSSAPQSKARFIRAVGDIATYECISPGGMTPDVVDLQVSFVNALRQASTYRFQGSVKFRFAPLPVVDTVYMFVGGQKIVMPNNTLSMPTCIGQCDNVLAFSVILEGSGFLPTSGLACRINNIRTRAFYISPTEVRCSLQSSNTSVALYGAITFPGRHAMFVSLNGQSQEWVESARIEFYDHPETVRDALLSFGVDPGLIGTTVADILGVSRCVGSQCNTRQSEYPQLGPMTGNTPLVFYLKEPMGASSANSSSSLNVWRQRGTISLRFGVCQSTCPPGTPESLLYGPTCSGALVCTCNEGPTSPVVLNSTQIGGGISFQYYKMTSFSAAATQPGRYRMCLSMNGVHYLPMTFAPGREFYFRYYRRPIVTMLSVTDGPINIPLNTYSINITGANFPAKVDLPDCQFVELGLCSEFSPRIYIYFGSQGTIAAGYGSMAQGQAPIDFSDTRVRVSPGFITMVMPDMSIISSFNFVANVTVSFNGYDFTPVMKGVTEFSFYRLPTVTRSLTPRWGHYDASTEIVIQGTDFQNVPGRSMCRIASCTGSCSQEGDVKVHVPATFVSPTQITCLTTPRPPSLLDDDSRAMYISYTPDGRDSTQRDNPQLFEAIVYPVGRFQLSDPIKRINISANAAPTQAGTSFQLVVIGHLGVNNTCFDMTNIDTLRVGLSPTSSIWRQIKPVGVLDYLIAPIASRRHLEDLSLVGTTAMRTCLMYINVTLPEIPYPLTADVKISLNNGQQFTGPTSTVLFYRSTPPVSNVPSRGSYNAVIRPQVSIYFDSALFEGANPEFSLIQTQYAFTPTPNCIRKSIQDLSTICAVGPQCRFAIGNIVRVVPATFTYDPFRSSCVCTAPVFPVTGLAQLSVTLDGPTFVSSIDTTFLFFDAPRVNFIAPTNGFWDARTNILVSGNGFLTNNDNTTHLSWCIFDFRDVLPASDVWDVGRRWTRAFTIPNGNTTLLVCRSPVITQNERPSLIRPRARVGVIVDGICLEQNSNGDCTSLKNSDAVLYSNAFFIYTDMPSITRANPVAGQSSGGGIRVTIQGGGFMNTYTKGPPLDWNPAILPLGYVTAQTQKLCANSSTTSPSLCPALSCRFGQSCPPNGGECRDRIVDGTIEGGNVICVPPPFESTLLTAVDLSVSLNGMTNEFSSPLRFTYTTMRVDSVFPVRGTAFGGGRISVTGSQFVNITCPPGSTRDCLTCRYTSSTGVSQVVPATFVSAQSVTCLVLPSSLFSIAAGTVTANCGASCDLMISVSVNSVEFVPDVQPNPPIKYTYMRIVTFTSFSPNAGPITGNTNVTIIGDNFVDNNEVQCQFGRQVVTARFRDAQTMICQVPSVAAATQGGVFVGFSTNGVDFCELTAPGVCEFTRSSTPTRYPFFYHDVLVANDISPPAGIVQGGTEVMIFGTGFTNYGQSLFARFKDVIVDEPCLILSSTQIRCYAPAMPTAQQTAGGVNVYIENVAVAVSVTSNRQQYTREETGQRCQPDPNIQNDDNPQAKCGDPFVMYSWFTQPNINRVSMANGQDVPSFNGQLNPNQYPDLRLRSSFTLPQGPTSGGTTVLIEGSDFTSLSRVELTNGPGVLCKNKPAPVGESCTTTCTFPYRHSITGQQVLYYSCINLRRLQDQSAYDPEEYWCAIHGVAPTTFSGEYGTCRYLIDTWKDFRQGGKNVTRLECLFGDTHVPARIISNSTISCVSPPSRYGIIVPLSVTFNRKDYSTFSTRTQFQYIAPAPMAVTAIPDNTVSRILISFNVATNRAGLQDPDGVVKPPVGQLDKSGCVTLFSDAFVARLGSTAPVCKWMPGDQILEITLTSNPTFLINEVVQFRRRACELSNTCWSARATDDLLSAPWSTPGCAYPKLTECNTVTRQSYKDDWCGRCIPSPTVMVNELSYPFNMSNTTLRISYPQRPLAPIPIIIAPSMVDTCTRLCTGGSGIGLACNIDSDCGINGVCSNGLVTLDGRSSTGNLGRAFAMVRWSLDPGFATPQTLRDQLAQTTNLLAPVRSTGLADLPADTSVTYCFRLELRNWLNVTGNVTNCRMVTRTSMAIPSILLPSGDVKTLYISDGVNLRLDVKPSACAPNNTAMTYVWDVTPMPAGWSEGTFSKLTSSLIIPAFAFDFDVGVPYNFRLNVTLTAGTLAPTRSSQNIRVTFAYSNPVAQISGGSGYQIGSSQALEVSGANSYDPNVPSGERLPSDLVYCWWCNLGTLSGQPCPWVNATNMTDNRVYVPPGSWLVRGATYVVSLTVARASPGLTCAMVRSGATTLIDSVFTTISVVNQTTLPRAVILPSALEYITNSQTIRLSADIMSGTCPSNSADQTMSNCGVQSYTWSTDQSMVNGFAANVVDGSNTGVGYGRITLIIKPGALIRQSCVCYTFRLTVTDVSGAQVSTSITFAHNTEPTSGSFVVQQSPLPPAGSATSDFGFALTTKWALTCADWTDSDSPLQYQFFYTSTAYDDSTQQANIPADVISLGPKQFSTSFVTVLPQGNLQNDNKMVLYAKIYDSLGAFVQVSTFVKVRSYPGSMGTAAYSQGLRRQVNSEITQFIGNKDTTGVMRYVALVGNTLLDFNLKQDLYKDDLTAIRGQCLDAIVSLFTSSRRAIGDTSLVNFQDYAVIKGLAQSLEPLSKQQLTTSGARSIVSLVKQAAFSGTSLTGTGALYDGDEEKTTLDMLVYTLANTQDALIDEPRSQWQDVALSIRWLLITYMKGKSAPTTYRADRNDMAVIVKRLSNVASSSASILGLDDPYVTLPSDVTPTSVSFTNMILSGLTGLSSEGVDYHIVAYNILTNPFKSVGTQTVFSRVVSMAVYQGLPLGSATLSKDVAEVTIKDLSESNSILLNTRVTGAPPKNKNATTGVFTATVCAFWNDTTSYWNQYSPYYVVGDIGGPLLCTTNHLTDFATVPGLIGCDNKASSTPTVLNICEECGGGSPKKMQKICDWQGVPCYGIKDRCGVCGGFNKSFVSDVFRNETGICNYLGQPCGQNAQGVQEEPTICGICGDPTRLKETQPNAGICDCQGTGVPNGGKVQDRCGICDGRNATMDFCGRNGNIPSALVCHTGGLDTTWNRSCTGCDGVPRPDLPWRQIGPAQGFGGVLLDACGICGGDGSNCTGCDGVYGSGAKVDSCGVCKGNDDTCLGCDAVPRKVPTQVDGCRVCGGKNFGSCDSTVEPPIPCNYTTLKPVHICKLDCNGVAGGGATYDRCGVCNGKGNTCANIGSGIGSETCGATWTQVTKCGCGMVQDKCGLCGGNSTTCRGCDGVPFSGKVFDACGICDGDNSTCIGCDGQVNSGKKPDLCGVCDGGNALRDLCGVCNGDGTSCTGCDGVVHSGKSMDACEVCGGANSCKWRDGDPPLESQGKTDAVVVKVELKPGGKRRSTAGLRVQGSRWGLLIGCIVCLSLIWGVCRRGDVTSR